MNEQRKIMIVGAGNSGLVAALRQIIQDSGVEVVTEREAPTFEIRSYVDEYPSNPLFRRERDYPTLRQGLRQRSIKTIRR